MLNLNQIADQVRIPNGMRPYFFETVKAMMVLEDFSIFKTSVLPMLIRLVLSCDILAPPREMADRLMEHFLSCLTYQDGPGGLRIPEFRCRTPVPDDNDHHAQFLAETVTSFVLMHPHAVKERR